jgi:hypothetical protein
MPEVKLFIYKQITTEDGETIDLDGINEIELESIEVYGDEVVNEWRGKITFIGDNILVYEPKAPIGDLITSFGYWVDEINKYRITLYTDELSDLSNLIETLAYTGLLEVTLVYFGESECECECK